MAILDGVKIKAAKLVEKTKRAFANFHYLNPTRSRRKKRDAIAGMKATATDRRKGKEKAIRRGSQTPKPRRKPNQFHLNLNRCTCIRCFSVQ